MAELTTAERQAINRGVQRHWSEDAGTEVTPYLSDALLAAIIATDEWIDGNQASFNNALPQPFRGAATLEQKTFVFCCVALVRAGGLALARQVLGGVD